MLTNNNTVFIYRLTSGFWINLWISKR